MAITTEEPSTSTTTSTTTTSTATSTTTPYLPTLRTGISPSQRTSVQLRGNCGPFSNSGRCVVPNSACVELSDGNWECRCVRNYVQSRDRCRKVPERVIDSEVLIDIGNGTLPRGPVKENIYINNTDGMDLDVKINTINFPENFVARYDSDQSVIILEALETIFVSSSVSLTLLVTATLEDHVIQNVVTVTLRPQKTRILNIVLVDGTKKNALVADTSGRSIYSEPSQDQYLIEGSLAEYLSIGPFGDIQCKRDISLDEIADVEAYAYYSNANLKKLASGELVATLHILIVRNKFKRNIYENIERQASIGKYYRKNNETIIKINNNIPRFFHVDVRTGDIKISNIRPNYEIEDERKLEFHITIDTQIGDFHVPIEINVLDINDEKPYFKVNNPVFNVIEGTPTHSIVGFVDADDKDTVGKLTYDIITPIYMEMFKIDSNGALENAVALTRHTVKEDIKFQVQVNDGESSSHTEVTIVLLTLEPNNTNLGLNFTGDLVECDSSVFNCSLSGYIVANVSVQNYTNFKFTSSRANKLFTLNSTTGIVTMKNPYIDREDRQNGFYNDEVLFSIHGALKEQEECSITILGDLTVKLLDRNDNAPNFTSKVYNGYFDENSVPGTVLTFDKVIYAEDIDEGPNGKVTYSFKGMHANLFQVYNGNNALTVELSPNAVGDAVDREENTAYDISVLASDGFHSVVADVIINIKDINDNRPTFNSKQPYKFSVEENITVSNTIGSVSASDPDKGRNGRVTYKIYNTDFRIDEQNGTITIGRNLDREVISKYSFTVYAIDDGIPHLTSSSSIMITVQDVNDNAPKFNQSIYIFDVYENKSCSDIIGTVEASDSDMGKNGQVNYEITDTNFQISSDGKISCVNRIDREKTTNNIQFVVRAVDGGSPSMSANGTVILRIYDVNDNAPVFPVSNYSINLNKNDFTASSIVKIVTATDKDSGQNGEVSFDLANGNASQILNISPDGIIRTRTRPLINLQGIYRAYIRATDHGSSKLSSTVELEVNVSDTSSTSRLVFERGEYNFTVEENVAQLYLGKLNVSNNGNTDKLLFNLDESEHFKINKSTGELYCIKPLDREKIPFYRLIATVEKEDTSGKAVALVEIYVLDVNDNDPKFLPGRETKEIPENAKLGTVVYTFSASDADEGENSTITYRLQNENLPFKINSILGTLSVDDVLDYETEKNYTFYVIAEDGGSPKRSVNRSFYIELSDVNDNPPEFLGTVGDARKYVINLYENTTLQSTVFHYEVSDADGTTHNRGSVYTIDGADCPLKAGNQDKYSEEQILMLESELDYETATNHSCNLTATNMEAPTQSNSILVLVAVLDVNDNAPVIQGGPCQLKINTTTFGSITTINATDADSNNNAELKFSLAKESPGSEFFEVDKVTGVVSVIRDLRDIEYTTVKLYISVSDHGAPSLSNSTTVTIEIQRTDTQPWFPGPGVACDDKHVIDEYKTSITEVYGDISGVKDFKKHDVISVTACDKNITQSVTCHKCRYHFLGKTDYFVLDPDTGVIAQIKAVDREITPSFRLKVRAVNDKNLTTAPNDAIVNITVIDVDDNPPTFGGGQYFHISQTAAVTSRVGDMIASDKDTGVHASSVYRMDTRNGPFDINHTTGEIFVAQTLNTSTIEEQKFSMLVNATNIKNVTMTANIISYITVFYEDPNKYSPKFTKEIYNIQTSRKAGTDTTVTTQDVKAEDKDKGNDGKITYTILDGNIWGLFRINNKTGEVKLNHLLEDFVPQSINVIKLVIKAEDDGRVKKQGFCTVSLILNASSTQTPNSTPKPCIGGTAPSTAAESYKFPFIAITVAAVVLLIVFVFVTIHLCNRLRGTLKVSRRLSTFQPTHGMYRDETKMTEYSKLYGKDAPYSQKEAMHNYGYDTLAKHRAENKDEEEYEIAL